MQCILVMQCFQVVYQKYPMSQTCIFWYTQEPLHECVYQENTSDEWDIAWLYHEKGLKTILYHAIKNTVAREGWV